MAEYQQAKRTSSRSRRVEWRARQAPIFGAIRAASNTLKDKISYNDSTAVYAPVAQLDRVGGFEPLGREFESLRVRQFTGL